jgi:hypothetical protein
MNHQCTNNQQCDMTPFSRNSCQFCRLKKCFAVGMSREASRLGRRPKRAKDDKEPLNESSCSNMYEPLATNTSTNNNNSPNTTPSSTPIKETGSKKSDFASIEHLAGASTAASYNYTIDMTSGGKKPSTATQPSPIHGGKDSSLLKVATSNGKTTPDCNGMMDELPDSNAANSKSFKSKKEKIQLYQQQQQQLQQQQQQQQQNQQHQTSSPFKFDQNEKMTTDSNNLNIYNSNQQQLQHQQSMLMHQNNKPINNNEEKFINSHIESFLKSNPQQHQQQQQHGNNNNNTSSAPAAPLSLSNNETTALQSTNNSRSVAQLQKETAQQQMHQIEMLTKLISISDKHTGIERTNELEYIRSAIIEAHCQIWPTTFERIRKRYTERPPARCTALTSSESGVASCFIEALVPMIMDVVKFCKCIPGFNHIVQHDQVQLLKQGSFEVICVNSFMLVDAQNRLMLTPSMEYLVDAHTIRAMPLGFFMCEVFELALQVASLKLTDSENSLFNALLIMNPGTTCFWVYINNR